MTFPGYPWDLQLLGTKKPGDKAPFRNRRGELLSRQATPPLPLWNPVDLSANKPNLTGLTSTAVFKPTP